MKITKKSTNPLPFNCLMYSILLWQREDYEKKHETHANITIALVNTTRKEIRRNETTVDMETYGTGKAMYQES